MRWKSEIFHPILPYCKIALLKNKRERRCIIKIPLKFNISFNLNNYYSPSNNLNEKYTRDIFVMSTDMK